jgi:prepilin-type N-terminal cleavage/methylation domain-containing protein
MKIHAAISILGRHHRRMAGGGFTLPELLIAMTIFVLMVGGILAANLFGLRMFQVSEAKLNVTQWSRETMQRVTEEIHVCNSAQVGTLTNGAFAGLLDGQLQQGNALLINLTTNTNSFIIYFVDTSDQTFRRTTDQPNSTVILASSITNTLPFSAQDFLGNPLTNYFNNQVIHLTLEFFQPGRFMVGSDYYKLETSVKQRIVP